MTERRKVEASGGAWSVTLSPESVGDISVNARCTTDYETGEPVEEVVFYPIDMATFRAMRIVLPDGSTLEPAEMLR